MPRGAQGGVTELLLSHIGGKKPHLLGHWGQRSVLNLAPDSLCTAHLSTVDKVNKRACCLLETFLVCFQNLPSFFFLDITTVHICGYSDTHILYTLEVQNAFIWLISVNTVGDKWLRSPHIRHHPYLPELSLIPVTIWPIPLPALVQRLALVLYLSKVSKLHAIIYMLLMLTNFRGQAACS